MALSSSIRNKLVISFLGLGIVVISALVLTQLILMRVDRSHILTGIERDLREGTDLWIRIQVETAHSMVERLHALGEEGVLDPEKAKEVATHLLRDIRYGRLAEDTLDGYFWADDSRGYNVVLYGREDVEGKPRGDLQDVMGTRIIEELRKQAMAGGGFTNYWFPRPGEDEPAPKRGYSLYHPGFDWIIGTGNYVDNIDAEMLRQVSERDQAQSTLLGWVATITVAVLVALVAIGLFLASSIAGPLRAVVGNLRDICSSGTLSVASDPRHAARKDEVGMLVQAVDDLVRQQQERAALAQAIANGDLSQRISPLSDADQLGVALRDMGESLRDTVGSLQQTIGELDTGTTQIADAANALSQGATESAASLEEISASMADIGGHSKDTARRAKEANEYAQGALGAAERGTNQVHELGTAMSEISSASKEIARINKVIDDIAFQTNLLALNAAVEAARAGRHGKGFAVVADEVRALATRSAAAAREAAKLVETAHQRVSSGEGASTATAEVLAEIHRHIQDAATRMVDINRAATEGAESVSQVSQGLGQIEQVTQANTASAEETAAACADLAHQSAALRHLADRFQLEQTSTVESHQLVLPHAR
ncbi:MAG: HAMP domain-containing protein [Planctomycetota bacterium]|nr:MAG: HAMP domain-containing protein [Planctomycetota bacterium]